MVIAVGITSEEVRSLGGQPAAARPARVPGLLKCLVLSGDRGLRGRLDAVTELSGWSACDAPEDAADLQAAIDGDYQLVIADVARPIGDRVNDTVEIVEEFAARPGTLVVVCGSEDSVDEELWARQIGAWVYLPGVSGGDALVSLLTDARRLVERRGEFQFA
ncbi:MAG: hypothetical protein ACKOZU_06415 [Planctomycetaceae bacterium]